MTRLLPLALLLIACGGGNSKPAPREAKPAGELPQSAAGIDRAVFEKQAAAMEVLARRSCACADAACVEAVDDDVGELYATATLNDPHDEIEVWPKDLDDRLHAAQIAHYRCVSKAKVPPYSLMDGYLRRFSAYRDAVCGCRDWSCADNLSRNLREKTKDAVDPPMRDEQRAEFARIVDQMRECAARLAPEELSTAVHELKALRTRACDCSDAACADAVQADFDAYLLEYRDATGPQSVADEISEIAAELAKCLDTARSGAGRPQ